MASAMADSSMVTIRPTTTTLPLCGEAMADGAAPAVVAGGDAETDGEIVGLGRQPLNVIRTTTATRSGARAVMLRPLSRPESHGRPGQAARTSVPGRSISIQLLECDRLDDGPQLRDVFRRRSGVMGPVDDH